MPGRSACSTLDFITLANCFTRRKYIRFSISGGLCSSVGLPKRKNHAMLKLALERLLPGETARIAAGRTAYGRSFLICLPFRIRLIVDLRKPSAAAGKGKRT